MNETLKYYDDQAESFVAGTVNVDFSAVQQEFATYVPTGGRILDLGCGSGRDSKAFMNMGYQVVAVDGSQELCRLASEIIGQEVIYATFQEYEPDAPFDGIWACASLLHLDADTLKEMLKKYALALKPGGVFYVSFKYGDYSGMRNGRFFTDMNEAALNEMLKDIPTLKLEKTKITGDVREDRANERWLNAFLKREN